GALMKKLDVQWLYPLKRKLLFGILGILSLSILATTVFIFLALRDGLAENSRLQSRELGNAVKASLESLMMTREPDRIQATLESLTENRDSIVKAFILDQRGTITYSTERREIGRVLDRFEESSCRPCHRRDTTPAALDTIVIDGNGSELSRNIMVIYNERPCYGCHAPSVRVNGKLIIDRSLKDTYKLITRIELIIFGSGLVCLVLLVPYLSRVLSRGLDTYIKEIISKHTELSLLYVMIERLSKTIDMEELKVIIIDIYRDSLEADEIDIIFPRDKKEFRGFTWNRRENDVLRKRIVNGDPFLPAVEKWLEGSLVDLSVSANRQEVFMPIVKAGNPLAFIIARRTEAPFQEERLELIDVMCSHIGVALENARLYHIAITDELTRLYTQRHFRTCIDKNFIDFQRYGEKYTLLMIDLDNFKRINDTHGHPVGDIVLRDVAQVILASIRDNDLAFRYGGEEFAVLLPGTGTRGGRHVAERIRRSIEEHVFDKGKHDLLLTVSIGCATLPDAALTVRDLILVADTRLYDAKKAGKNRVIAGE
ncbi:MAG TPA: GGDEF domain-containing protein, partial [Nitrospirota bacterium]|nr:GGDEF domain-containing protein [Nitrospirota bacterium]